MKLSINELKYLPHGHDRISGVYFLFSYDKLIYIGASVDLGRRLSDMRCINEFLKFGIISEIVIILCNDKLYKIESDAIRFFKPIANRIKNKI